MCCTVWTVRCGRKNLLAGDKHTRMAQLLVELLRSDGLPDLVYGGAYLCLKALASDLGSLNKLGTAAVCSLLLDMDICRLAMTHLQAIGSAAEWVVSGTLMRWPRCVPSN